eukprot:TRINITY_DN24749_c0_g1_i1.p1 TRINITY_DN24749_c0_g1~~TRINITY_DN24749_c0_g1_i1.p1  ORF type:complete len:124 (-),score=10.11 TRINITY_DN24749_c0_g1_i1:136-507(-)
MLRALQAERRGPKAAATRTLYQPRRRLREGLLAALSALRWTTRRKSEASSTRVQRIFARYPQAVSLFGLVAGFHHRQDRAYWWCIRSGRKSYRPEPHAAVSEDRILGCWCASACAEGGRFGFV